MVSGADNCSIYMPLNYLGSTLLEYIWLAMQSNLSVAFIMYTGSDFQLDPDNNLATVTNNVSDHGRCFRIIITEDSDSEPTEQFNINFTVISVQPEGVNISTFSEAIIHIQDDDGKSHYWASLCEVITTLIQKH